MLTLKPSEFESFFNFELSSYPKRIFDSFNMRKNKKSDFFLSLENDSLDNNVGKTFAEMSLKFVNLYIK